MTTTPTGGAADLPDAMHMAELLENPINVVCQKTAAQPGDIGRKSIDMVLHCPKCGLQHIDKDNYEELRIEAAELGVDREGDRELERWIEEREWPNPPHRSHLCASCKHIWRPADVCTNGVLAVKTKGQEDSPIEDVATRIYGGGRGGWKANKELLQLINEVHRENIDYGCLH